MFNSVLVRILNQLTCPDEKVRDCVIRICNHIDVRFRDVASLKLPVADLIQLFYSPLDQSYPPSSTNPTNFARNTFTLMFIQKGLERLPKADISRSILSLLANLPTQPPQHQNSILHLFLIHVDKVDLSGDEQQLAERFHPTSSNITRKVMLNFFEKLFLYKNPIIRNTPAADNKSSSSVSSLSTADSKQAGNESKYTDDTIPDGMSLEALQALTKQFQISPPIQARKYVLNFLAGNKNFTENELYPLYLAATCIGAPDVTSRAEDLLKR